MDTQDSRNYEKERVIHNIENEVSSSGLRVANISKYFKTSQGPFRALHQVYFEV